MMRARCLIVEGLWKENGVFSSVSFLAFTDEARWSACALVQGLRFMTSAGLLQVRP